MSRVENPTTLLDFTEEEIGEVCKGMLVRSQSVNSLPYTLTGHQLLVCLPDHPIAGSWTSTENLYNHARAEDVSAITLRMFTWWHTRQAIDRVFEESKQVLRKPRLELINDD